MRSGGICISDSKYMFLFLEGMKAEGCRPRRYYRYLFPWQIRRQYLISLTKEAGWEIKRTSNVARSAMGLHNLTKIFNSSLKDCWKCTSDVDPLNCSRRPASHKDHTSSSPKHPIYLSIYLHLPIYVYDARA